MKKLTTTLLLLSTLLFGGTINLEISEIENEQNTSLFIGLFNTADGFPKNMYAYKSFVLEANATTLKCTFEDISEGVYSIAIFHDKNNNQILDKNFFGIPSEGYGFSNNLKPTFSTPKFEEAEFVLNQIFELEIEMNY